MSDLHTRLLEMADSAEGGNNTQPLVDLLREAAAVIAEPPQTAREIVDRLIAKIERQTKADLTWGEEVVVLFALRAYAATLPKENP